MVVSEWLIEDRQGVHDAIYTCYTHTTTFVFSASLSINNKTQNEANALGSNWRHLNWLWLAESKTTKHHLGRTSNFLFSSSLPPSTSPPKKTLPRQRIRRAGLSVYLVCLSLITHSIFCLAIRNFLLYALSVVSVSCQGKWKISLCSGLGAYADQNHETDFFSVSFRLLDSLIYLSSSVFLSFKSLRTTITFRSTTPPLHYGRRA